MDWDSPWNEQPRTSKWKPLWALISREFVTSALPNYYPIRANPVCIIRSQQESKTLSEIRARRNVMQAIKGRHRASLRTRSPPPTDPIILFALRRTSSRALLVGKKYYREHRSGNRINRGCFEEELMRYCIGSDGTPSHETIYPHAWKGGLPVNHFSLPSL